MGTAFSTNTVCRRFRLNQTSLILQKRGQFELAKKHYFKFMFVRHPLERLISAYEDKVVKADHPSLRYLRKSIFITHEDIHIRNKTYELLR